MTGERRSKAKKNGRAKARPAPTRSVRRGTPSPPSPLIVGIGASAGGLNAFKAFFAHMPPDSGMAFVLVQHLDPSHESMLVELLGRHTAMTVVEAEDGMRATVDRIAVIPPNATLTIKRGVLRVTRPAPARENRRPIDTFFSSLAEDQGECAVCIVLSGTGSDGALGLRKVKEHGGLTLAQGDLDATAMSGMPHSAAATGLVDHIMPVENMPAMLVDYRRHLVKVAGRKDADGHRKDAPEHLSAISALLRAGTGHDFKDYKPNTLVRRVQRRMQVLRIDTVPEFIDRLRKDPREVELLFREFLIGVTQFFRDPQVFDALEATVIPRIFEAKTSGDPVRVWVPGCATGEEVYSIAILLREAMDRLGIAPHVQIFGTDIDAAAVAHARTARYRKAMIGMSRERTVRWFAEDGDECSPIKEIREMCVFSTHSVIKDPPFSRLDLISCRNLLIYLGGDLQDRVMRAFHYALRPGGFLVLGSSESVNRNAKLFTSLDKKHRIYQRQDASGSSPPELPLPPPSVAAQPRRASAPAPHGRDQIESGIRRIMAKHSPAYVVIDKRRDILSFSGGEVGRYLEPSAGAASLNLFDIAHRKLRPAVRAAVQRAVKTGDSVVTETVALEIDGKIRSIAVIVEPMPEAGLYVVAFQDAGPALAMRAGAKASATAAHADVQALEHELHTTRTELRAAIDELETVNEEMKSANEEYQSVNEELQSSNEELETSKEEMQSVNEELQTINAEMNGKNDMLSQLNSDLKNLLDSTQIATIFLDDKLHIKTFTPGMTDIFHLRDSDRGRPITEIAARINYADLARDAKKVQRTLTMVEREVTVAADDATFLMRIRPYRTVDNVIDGVVITFVDISARKRHESVKAQLAAIVDSSQDAIIGHTLDGTITSWNEGAENIFGYPEEEAIGKPISILLPEDQIDDVPRLVASVKRGEAVEHFEIDRIRKDGRKIDVSLTISPVKDSDGAVIAASTVAREFTERKVAEDHKSLLISELDHRVKNILAIITSLVAQTAKSVSTPAAFAEALEGRIQSLSRVHNLLTQNNWDRATLREVVEAELAPYRAGDRANVMLRGAENVVLMPKATATLAMALHELATNAAKYGALSVSEGRLEVTWKVRKAGSNPLLAINWVETGGPPVKTPTRRGFGSQLIERAVVYELLAKVERTFSAEGVRCRIEFPLTDKTGYVRSADDGGS